MLGLGAWGWLNDDFDAKDSKPPAPSPDHGGVSSENTRSLPNAATSCAP